MIAIIDYDAGNIKSVEKAFALLGEEVVLSRDREEILSADRVVLPGVGSFGDAMGNLNRYGLVPVIHEVAEKQIPFLGICLGLQLMFEESEESPGVEGLGLLKGKILHIPKQEGLKIPHMGWNQRTYHTPNPLFQGIPEGQYVYFVHSFCADVEEEKDLIASTWYGERITAAAAHENVMGMQYHPEKSSTVGLQMLKNFAQML